MGVLLVELENLLKETAALQEDDAADILTSKERLGCSYTVELLFQWKLL